MEPTMQVNFSKVQLKEIIKDCSKLEPLGITTNNVTTRVNNLLIKAEKLERLERFGNLLERAENDDRIKKIIEIAKVEKENPLNRGYFKIIVDNQFLVSWSRFFGSQTCEFCQMKFEPYGRGSITNLKTQTISNFSTISLHKIALHGYFSIGKERVPPLQICQAVFDDI